MAAASFGLPGQVRSSCLPASFCRWARNVILEADPATQLICAEHLAEMTWAVARKRKLDPGKRVYSGGSPRSQDELQLFYEDVLERLPYGDPARLVGEAFLRMVHNNEGFDSGVRENAGKVLRAPDNACRVLPELLTSAQPPTRLFVAGAALAAGMPLQAEGLRARLAFVHATRELLLAQAEDRGRPPEARLDLGRHLLVHLVRCRPRDPILKLANLGLQCVRSSRAPDPALLTQCASLNDGPSRALLSRGLALISTESGVAR